MTRAERLLDRMSALEAGAFRLAELQRRAAAERERLEAIRDLLDCDLDALDDLDTDAIDLDLEVDEASDAAA